MADEIHGKDGGAPLRLMAEDADDLAIISSLAQDAVFPASEMVWQRDVRRFAILLNRFRWENRAAAERSGRPYERVQSLLAIRDALQVRSQGIPQGDADTVLSLLSVAFEPGEAGVGRIVLTLAGDGAVAVDVECLDVTLMDVTQPYAAPSGCAPGHPE